jgi:hypothetical protein
VDYQHSEQQIKTVVVQSQSQMPKRFIPQKSLKALHLEESRQKCILMIKTGLTKAGSIYDAIMKWKGEPIDGGRLYQVAREWRIACSVRARAFWYITNSSAR